VTIRFIAPITALAYCLVLAGSAAAEQDAETRPAASANGAVHLDVYKSPTCGCCTLWMDHLEEHGMTTTGHHPDELGVLKLDLGVPVRYGSCHTAVSMDGYLFEGHVPARSVRSFLDSPPAGTLGLTVPAMPLGSPGMEYNDQFMPYDVLLLHKDGSVEVYASMETYDAQFD
jgi:hypothetical protein